MRRTFRPQTHWELSSVYVPGHEGPQISSDAPTRPVSSNRGAYNPAAAPQSSFMNARVNELPTDDAENMSILPQESLIPPPAQDIPDSRIALRYHMQRNADQRNTNQNNAEQGPADYQFRSPVEVSLANRNIPEAVKLSPGQLQQAEEIYTTLRSAGLNVPHSPSIPMSPTDLYAAVRHYFERVSPLPAEYTPTAQNTLYLVELLGYDEDRIEVDMFALRMPIRNAAWPIIIDMLWWLHILTLSIPSTQSPNDINTGSGSDSGEENHTEKGIYGTAAGDRILNQTKASGMCYESYYELATVNAFALYRQNGSIPDEYVEEVRATLRNYQADTEAAIKERRATAEEHSRQLADLVREVSGLTSDIAKCDQLQNVLSTVKNSISEITEAIYYKHSSVDQLQQQVGGYRTRDAESEQELQQLHDKVIASGISSVEEAVQLAATYRDLKERHAKLSETVYSLRKSSLDEYDRPARQGLTAIRIALDEYNDGIDPRFAIQSKVSNLDEILGLSISSLLNGNGDLSPLRWEWHNLESSERSSLRILEDEVSSIQIEIASMEKRIKSYNSKFDILGSTIEQLTHEKDHLVEAISRMKHQQVMRKEQAEHRKVELAALNTSIEALLKENRRLQEESQQAQPKIKHAVEQKVKYEEMLVEYQNAYNLLGDKIDQLEQVSNGLIQAKSDAELLINELKPSQLSKTSLIPHGYNESDSEIASQKATELLKTHLP